MPTPLPYQLTNTAQNDPELQRYLQTWYSQLATMNPDENALRAESDAQTKRMISQASGDIADRAAGANAALSEDLARRGVAGGGLEQGSRSGLSSAAQRQQARAATDITLAQNDKYETQKLARQNMRNNFIQGGLAAAGSLGQNKLAQQQLGLQQYQAMNNQGNQDVENWMRFYQQGGGAPATTRYGSTPGSGTVGGFGRPRLG